VTTDVLIPRSETEILVELAAQELKNYKNKKCRLIDIGTGSGAIILSLMTEEGATLEATASDISEKALNVARLNFFNQRYMIPAKHTLKFVKSDRLESVEGEFDLIVTNPPYIKKTADFDQVHHQVAIHEPHLALFLDDQSYDQWFQKFFESIYKKLSDTGVSLVEGHENHLEAQAVMARAIGFSKVDVIKDYTHRSRFLKLKK
jgi:release factor glutamine methyltransferase